MYKKSKLKQLQQSLKTVSYLNFSEVKKEQSLIGLSLITGKPVVIFHPLKYFYNNAVLCSTFNSSSVALR